VLFTAPAADRPAGEFPRETRIRNPFVSRPVPGLSQAEEDCYFRWRVHAVKSMANAIIEATEGAGHA
jgi:hypothetical protein